MASREQIAIGKPSACPSTGAIPPAEPLLFRLFLVVASNSFANPSLPSQIYSPLTSFCGWLETSGLQSFSVSCTLLLNNRAQTKNSVAVSKCKISKE